MKLISEHIKPLLALVVVVMTYTIFMIILFKYKTDNNAVSQVIIAVVGGFGVATGYYFGSNSGSSKKDDVINDLAKTNTYNPASGTTTTGDVNIDTNKTGNGKV